MHRPHILITNDDGIHAPGIKHLWNSLKHYANVTVVAPASEQSAVGLSVTLRSPLHLQQIHWGENSQIWSVSGTPADCVKMALNVVMKNRPDIVVSGINRGANSGRNVLYSGTVAGTIEAVMHDIPGIAFSCYDFDHPDYEGAQPHITNILDYVLAHPLPSGTLLNVNFPARNLPIKGFKMARQAKGYWGEDPERRQHPVEGNHYYWLGARLVEFDEYEDGDIHLLNQGYVTAVPVHVGELTDHRHLEAQKSNFERHFEKK